MHIAFQVIKPTIAEAVAECDAQLLAFVTNEHDLSTTRDEVQATIAALAEKLDDSDSTGVDIQVTLSHVRPEQDPANAIPGVDPGPRPLTTINLGIAMQLTGYFG